MLYYNRGGIDVSNLGDMIKEKREDVGLSQKKLASACSLSDSEIMKVDAERHPVGKTCAK